MLFIRLWSKINIKYFGKSSFIHTFEYKIIKVMETKKKMSPQERERILSIVRKSAERYRETNRILDAILPDITDGNPFEKKSTR
jgi:hypothetical protein